MPVSVRHAHPSDRAAALRLWRLLQDDHEALEPRIRRSDSAEARWRTDFTTWVLSDAHGIFVADDDEAGVVGLATAHPYWPAPVYSEIMDVYINEFIVLPEWRGRGVGRRLVAAVQAWARERGAAQVRAGVLSVNPEALAFWRGVGAEDFFVTVTLPAGDAASGD
jgi:GNAT superfamily N-acetyltransferase